MMIKRVRTIGTTLIVSALLLALVACQKQEGPAERAGKAVDNATEKAGQQIEQAGKNIQDTAKGDKK
jgi:predicted small secreted protein